MLFNDSDILVETEDGTSQQKRLGDVIEQSSCHVIYLDYLISHECNAAHNEQHGTGVLRDFLQRTTADFFGLLFLQQNL